MRLGKLKFIIPVVLLMVLLAATASTALPYFKFCPEEGYYCNKVLYYILTDVTTYDLQAKFYMEGFDSPAGINVTPKLENAAAAGVNIPVLYYVTNGVGCQKLVFGTQWPNATYMPIWKVIRVRWYNDQDPKLLTSAEAVNIEYKAGHVQLYDKGEFAGASILINTAGCKIKQAQTVTLNGRLCIILPKYKQFCDWLPVYALMLDFGYQSEACEFGANYAPAMNALNNIRKLNLCEPWRIQVARFTQLLWKQEPINKDCLWDYDDYSPLVNEWQATVTCPPLCAPIKCFDDIPCKWPLTPTNFMGFEPLLPVLP